eukprot:TRINITY_DN32929_c0_g1_i1.p2 TRINITY_DN32929_c0_g1~~TRINITY_DN32929_c0_g1_i1.p2  ORF type:complete len:100 (+),score=26.44 TRINITY_DN32929_c0_g1_i1:41-340(+)
MAATEQDIEALSESVAAFALDCNIECDLDPAENARASAPPSPTAPSNVDTQAESFKAMVQMAQMLSGPTQICMHCNQSISVSLYEEHTTTWCSKITSSW